MGWLSKKKIKNLEQLRSQLKACDLENQRLRRVCDKLERERNEYKAQLDEIERRFSE